MTYRTLQTDFVRFLSGLFLIVLLASPVLAENSPMSDETLIQAMFGISILDEENTTLGSSTDQISPGRSTFPILSIMGQTPVITGTSVMAGFEGGGELSWLNDKSQVVSTGGTTVVYLKNKMFMGNILLGGFVSTDPGKHARFYAGAGTSLNWGRMSLDSDYSDTGGDVHASASESSFGYGFYLRGGMEFMLADGGQVGICAKLSTARIDYDSSFSRNDFDGFQIMMSYTAPLRKFLSPGL